jgi:N-acetylmuramoyl-L-alanine amidase
MTQIPGIPGIPTSGSRAKKAARLMAEMEAKKKQAEAQAAAAAAAKTGDGGQAPAAEQAQDGPVGQGDYLVKPGDCIASIAKQKGHFWKTIWNDPGNTELQQVRKQPNVLREGDRVTIPPLRPKQEPGETEMRHRFKRKGEPSHLKIRLEKQGQPRASQPYKLTIDDRVFEGTTDADGKLDVPIPGNARRGKLEVGTPPDVAKYDINLGELEPVETWKGVQARLKNLGFDCDPTGKPDEQTLDALNAFRQKEGLPPADDTDDATRKLLQEKHGS